MSEKYYTDCPLSEGEVEAEVFYVFIDMEKPFDKMLRWTKEVPQDDRKMSEPYYLDPATFWDKVSDRYIASR